MAAEARKIIIFFRFKLQFAGDKYGHASCID